MSQLKSAQVIVVGDDGRESRYDFGLPIPHGTPAEYVAPSDTPGTDSLAAAVVEVRDLLRQVKSLAMIEQAPSELRLREINRLASLLFEACDDIDSLLGV